MITSQVAAPLHIPESHTVGWSTGRTLEGRTIACLSWDSFSGLEGATVQLDGCSIPEQINERLTSAGQVVGFIARDGRFFFDLACMSVIPGSRPAYASISVEPLAS